VKTLYLLRHLKSSWDDPSLADADRPLAPRGVKAGRRVARHLRQAGVAPDLVLCSPSRRTRETLDAVRASLGEPEVRFVDAVYGASHDELLDLLRAVVPEVASVLVIGHNPGLEDLARLLGGVEWEKFPTGAFVTLAVRDDWAELGPAACELTGFVVPRGLG
jgi:phosphohistidine phosphatase